MTRIESNFESLATGTTPTTANTNYTGVTIGAGNTLTTDSTFTRNGQVSSLKHFAAAAASQFCYWSTAGAGFGAGLPRWGRAYLYFPSLPTASITLFGFMTAAFGNVMTVRWGNGSQRIVMFDGAGASAGASTTVLPTGKWIRIEAWVSPGTTTSNGSASVSLFYTSPDGTTPDETISVSGTGNFGTIAPGQHFNGISNAIANQTFYVSDVAFDDTGAIGPDATGSNFTQTLNDPVGVTDTANRTLTTPSVWTFNHSISLSG